MSMQDRDTNASDPADTDRHILASTGWEQQARFESLLADISTHLLNVPAEAVDVQIVDALHRLVTHLGVDRGSISMVDASDGRLRTSHNWSAAAVPPIPMGLGEVELPWAATQIRAGIPIVFSRPEQLPHDVVADRAIIRQIGVQSAALLPLSAGGKLLGTVHFSDRHPNGRMAGRDPATPAPDRRDLRERVVAPRNRVGSAHRSGAGARAHRTTRS